MPEGWLFVAGLAAGLLAGLPLGRWWLSRPEAGLQQSLHRDLTDTRRQLEAERLQNLDLHRQQAALEADYRNLEDRLRSQHDTLQQAFKQLADDLLEEKSRRFTDQNQHNLSAMLHPLGERIQAFEQKLENNVREGIRDRASLLAELRKLHELSQRLSHDADHLAKALKGDTRRQGAWGELILERVLERSGLVNGVEYKTQLVTRNADQATIRPDVVVFLPEEKHLIIDAKVSLTAYERCLATDDEAERNHYLTAHVGSLRSHIRLLADKRYETAEGLLTPEFVLLFIPIEPAFGLAVQGDADLFAYAWDRRVVLVSPSTLLATLRTVASLWKVEKQNRNALEIARLSGDLYDKFVGFTQDLQKTGAALQQAQNSYDDAFKKLSTGRGNLIRTAERVRLLGARANRRLGQTWLDAPDDDAPTDSLPPEA